MSSEIVIDPFEVENVTVCNCKELRPEVIGRILPTAFTEEEELYICRWCEFIREFGMADELEGIENKIFGISTSDEVADEYYDIFGKHFLREYEEYYHMRRFYGATITFAREALNLSIKELADCLELPEYVIENLESGKDTLAYARSRSLVFSGVARPLTSEEITDIGDRVHKFLLAQKRER